MRVKRVDVELGHGPVLVGSEQVRHGQLAGGTGVEEAAERVHEDGRLDVDVVGHDLVQVLRSHAPILQQSEPARSRARHP